MLSHGLAAIVGLRAEARLARRLRVPVFVGGGTASGAGAATARAIASGATALLSFGLAGGLDPRWRAGDILVPSVVLCGTEALPTDATLMAWLGGATAPTLLGADLLVADATEKRRLWQQTGAAALDLESGAVARGAAAHGLRFAVLRAICDPAERDLPPAATAALDGRGAIGLARVAGSVVAHPTQLAALLALARDANKARAALGRRVRSMR